MAMQFMSDNAARVHPRVWAAMQAADAPDAPYDGDALSQRLDQAFSALFGRDCAALWVASGTAANGLGLSLLVQPWSGVICHEKAHIETSECGAPGLFTHGAKLHLAGGEGAKITPNAIEAVLESIRKDVHQPKPQAVSITQASEQGQCYRPQEVSAVAATARAHGMKLHMDGARFANAVAFLGCTPAETSCDAGVDVLSFGCVKNGGMGAEALVLFDPSLADELRFRRKQAGHLQSKGRFLAAQVLALVEDGLWLDNARAANAAAREIGAAAGGRLLYPVESNQVFFAAEPEERASLRAQGFAFYDWGEGAARVVTAWDSDAGNVSALARAVAGL